MDAKKTSGMFLRIAQNGDSVRSLSSAIAPSCADERRSAHWRLCALDAPGCCSFFVLSTSVTLLLEPMKSMFLSSLLEGQKTFLGSFFRHMCAGVSSLQVCGK